MAPAPKRGRGLCACSEHRGVRPRALRSPPVRRLQLPSPTVRLDGAPLRATTTLSWSGPWQLTLTTTVALDGLELVSSYLGHPGGHGEVAISHLELVAGDDPVTSTLVRAGDDLLVGDRHRCLLDHLQALQELVEDHTDAHVAVDVGDAALASLDAV